MQQWQFTSCRRDKDKLMNSPIQIWRQHKNLHNYLGKKGKLLVWTKIFVAPSGFEHQVPYLVGIVKFDSGEKMPVQIVDCQEKDLPAGRQGLKPNQKVEVVIRKIGKAKSEDVIEYGVKVKPVKHLGGGL